ncbi:hypothetical protein [Nocardioides marmoraquaticus]
MPSHFRRAVSQVPEPAKRRLRPLRDKVVDALGHAPEPEPAAPARPGPRSQDLWRTLREGGSLGERAVAQVRELLERGETHGAVALATSLEAEPETEQVGRACAGVVATARGNRELAWQHLGSLPAEVWSRLVAAEYLDAGLLHAPDEVVGEVRGLLQEPPASRTPAAWMALLELVFAHGHLDLARDLFAHVDASVAEAGEVDGETRSRRDWVARWIDRSPDQPGLAREGDVSFAVVDYDHPGRRRASANIGDHVQTLASLGHLVRRQGLEFTGPDELVGLVEELAARVPEHRRLPGASGRVQLLTVDRDSTEYNEVPDGTWVLAFGWYMHAIFGVRYGLPMHRNLRPIFVSFHCNKRGILTPEAIAWMREHGPVGCRDWTTVDILLSVGVPAFFSGCMTTTVDSVFPVATAAPHGPVAYVDSPEEAEAAGPDAAVYKHSADAVRFRSFTDNMRIAMQLLQTYRDEHSSVVTSRLHCYLPERSLGATVDFRPKNPADIRFAGLSNIDDDAFHAIRDGINTRLQAVFDLALAGAPEAEVYARWRELCADDVEAARARRAAPAQLEQAPSTDAVVEGMRRDAVEVAAAPDGATHVAVVGDGARRPQLQVVLDSLARTTSGPLHVWFLDTTGEGGPDLLDVVPAGHGATYVAVPDLSAWLPRRGGPVQREHLAKLLLPALLPDTAERVVVVPLAGLVRGDVTELARIDLGETWWAANDVPGDPDASGFAVVHRAGDRLRERTAVATELRRVAHARHDFDFSSFELDVLVLDLAAWRREGVTGQALDLAHTFDLLPREAMHVLAGPHRTRVPRAWHVVPDRLVEEQPRLLHWASRPHPWGRETAPAQQAWLEASARVSPGAAPA